MNKVYAVSFEDFCQKHEADKDDGLRIGQRFYTYYIKPHKHFFPDVARDVRREDAIYYEPDEQKARKMIQSWLNDHQYFTNMPPQVREE